MSDSSGPRLTAESGPAFSRREDAGASAILGKLAALLRMEERLRGAEKAELPFIVVNETHLLVGYRQAVLWRNGGADSIEPLAVSGLAVPDRGSPYLQWLGRVARGLRRQWEAAEGAAGGLAVTAADLPEDLRADWADWLPAYGFFLPLPRWPKPGLASAATAAPAPSVPGTAPTAPPDTTPSIAKPPVFGFLTLFSQEPFSPADLRLLEHLAGAYGQALSLHFKPRPRAHLGPRRFWILGGALLAVLLFPVRQSVLAPAEVIAQNPWPVRSHLEGVVESILVEPNAQVKKGQTLLKLDQSELDTRLAVAVKSLEIAKAELRQARQQALGEREAKLRLAYLSGRVDQLEAEKVYVESLLERAAIQSPLDGVALVDAPEEWAGKPVSLGQRIMTVADPTQVRLEVFLPMDGYLPQAANDEVLFFPNVSPGSPLTARLTQVGYQAQETAQAGLAFRLRADFEAGQAGPRLGVRGSAKLYGRRVPLVYLLLRQPLTRMRQWLGF